MIYTLFFFFYSRLRYLFRTKALVLELLAAICLVKGGHEIILSAFDNFKEVCQEKKRFQTLMDYFMNYDVFHIEFMVNIICFKYHTTRIIPGYYNVL